MEMAGKVLELEKHIERAKEGESGGQALPYICNLLEGE